MPSGTLGKIPTVKAGAHGSIEGGRPEGAGGDAGDQGNFWQKVAINARARRQCGNCWGGFRINPRSCGEDRQEPGDGRDNGAENSAASKQAQRLSLDAERDIGGESSPAIRKRGGKPCTALGTEAMKKLAGTTLAKQREG